MSRVAAFRIEGCDLFFYSNDHRPAHFHARVPGDWEIRVFFLHEPISYDQVFCLKRIPSTTLRELLEAARQHRVELLAEWTAKVAPDERD